METFDNIKRNTIFLPEEDWLSIKTIDMHTGGEPLRVVVSGFPELKGNSILEYRSFIRANLDHLRTALMFEPRGHADMYGCILTPPVSPQADFGIIFMHNEGYSTMCGHATIAIAKLAVEMNWVEVSEPVTEIGIDAPCGLLKAQVVVENNKAINVSFDNVPSFVSGLDLTVNVDGMGHIKYDLAYGGAFYAFVNADKMKLDLTPDNHRMLIDRGMAIKKAVMESNESIRHPFEEDLSFLYGTIFIGKPHLDGSDSRNVCIFANGELDRSPTGSGVSARMAIHYKRNEIDLNEWMTIESILGSTFDTCVKEIVNYGGFEGVIPRVRGNAHVTGQHEFMIDPKDPMRNGFILR
ncbi:MAG: proline racemase [Saprospiraceae bacterium]|nr:proline racemase [Saprospiraceae bacterium]